MEIIVDSWPPIILTVVTFCAIAVAVSQNRRRGFFVVIRCGHEGIENLVYASRDGKDASAKVLSMRSEILAAQARMAACGGEDAYDRMLHDKEIDFTEYTNATYNNPDAICVQKWDGRGFSCACAELGCKSGKPWFM